MSICQDERLYVIGIDERSVDGNLRRLAFRTTRGDFEAIIHLRKGMDKGVIMLSGLMGGFAGPDGMYAELARELFDCGVTSMRLDYRVPGDCAKCAIDALLSAQYMDDEGVRDLVLLGWSFGGAVAIAAGSMARMVRGVVAVSSTDISGCCIKWLQSKPVLLLHGGQDKVSSPEVSRRIYIRSRKPSQFAVYPGAGHDLGEVRERFRDDVKRWILATLNAAQKAA